jgi:hypothetical protein
MDVDSLQLFQAGGGSFPRPPALSDSPFQGASSSAVSSQCTVHQCGRCGFFHCNYSYFAYVYNEDGYPFARNVDIQMRRAISRCTEQLVVVNAFDPKPVVRCCIESCEELHRLQLFGGSYFRVDSHGRRVPSSQWLRRARATSGCHAYAKRVEWVLKMHEAKTGGSSHLAAPIYRAMQSEQSRRAMDWVVEIGGRHAFLWVMYGCAKCRHYPVRSNCCYRVTRNMKDDQLGDTSLGASTGFWHCGNCFTRWCWSGGGQLRLVVLGDADSRSGFKDGYGMAYIGNLSEFQEAKIAFLRSGRALTVLDGKPVSRDSLLSVIDECNQQVHGVFIKGVAEAVKVTSMVVPQHELDRLAAHLVCEDARLSLHRTGVQYLALDMTQQQQLTTIDLDLFDFMLDVSAALMDFPEMMHGSQASKVAHHVSKSSGYACARKALKSRL